MLNLFFLLLCMLSMLQAKEVPTLDGGFYKCNYSAVAEKLQEKVYEKSLERLVYNPYLSETEEHLQEVYTTNNNSELVCAIKYTSSDNITYTMETFSSASAATQSGYTVTHYGRCGYCSSLHDLSIYIKYQDLTSPMRMCGILKYISEEMSFQCIKYTIGFTDSCAQMWIYNAHSTGKHCMFVCTWMWILQQPSTWEDGTVNECHVCDETHSGPIFKYYAGRTRRNSGLHCEIGYNPSEILDIDQCFVMEEIHNQEL